MSSVVLPNPGEELSGTVASLDECAFGQCLNGVAQTIMALQLPRVLDDRVHVRWDRFVNVDGEGRILDKLPCIIISPVRSLRPDSVRGSNRENAVHFFVRIAIWHASGVDGINQMGACLSVIQQIYVAFSKKPASDLFEVNDDMLLQTTIGAAEIENERAERLRLLVQYIDVDCLLRLPYGEVA